MLRRFAAQVVADQRRWQAFVGDQAIDNRVAQVDVSSRSPFVALEDQLLVENTDLADHEETEVLDEVVGKLPIGDVIALNVEAKRLPLDSTAVGEIDLEIKLHPFISHGVGEDRSG
jgi:ligand-binding SRPBCC domain-containing protein